MSHRKIIKYYTFTSRVLLVQVPNNVSVEDCKIIHKSGNIFELKIAENRNGCLMYSDWNKEPVLIRDKYDVVDLVSDLLHMESIEQRLGISSEQFASDLQKLGIKNEEHANWLVLSSHPDCIYNKLLSFGFKQKSRFARITEDLVYDLNRGRSLIVSDIGTTSEFVMIASEDKGNNRDVVILWNFDFDGNITFRRIKVIIKAIGTNTL